MRQAYSPGFERKILFTKWQLKNVINEIRDILLELNGNIKATVDEEGSMNKKSVAEEGGDQGSDVGWIEEAKMAKDQGTDKKMQEDIKVKADVEIEQSI